MPATREAPPQSPLMRSIMARQAGIFDAIRATNDRNHRFTRSLIESARQGNRDWSEVGRRWMENPTNVSGIYDAIADAIANTQTRTIALSREWFEDAVETQRESREVLRQGFGDVREAVERSAARVPSFLRRNSRSDGNSGTA